MYVNNNEKGTYCCVSVATGYANELQCIVINTHVVDSSEVVHYTNINFLIRDNCCFFGCQSLSLTVKYKYRLKALAKWGSIWRLEEAA
jgi:hypothetical protein